MDRKVLMASSAVLWLFTSCVEQEDARTLAQDREQRTLGQGNAETPAQDDVETPAQDDIETPAQQPAERGVANRRALPIPELAAAHLPLVTGEKPDPEREAYARDPVFVRVDEYVKPREGEFYSPEIPLVGKYLAEYFRRAGHPVVETQGDAKLIVVGSVECEFVKPLTFREQVFAVQFQGTGSVRVLGPQRDILAEFDIPGVKGEGILPELENNAELKGRVIQANRLPEPRRIDGENPPREEINAITDLRRRIARDLWRGIFYEKGPLSDGEISRTLDSLAVDDPAGDPADGDRVVDKLVALRLKAVPYLIEALTDDRPVLVKATYKGLTPANASQLRVYHLADRALENVFQKVSRMGLGTPDKHRFVIIRGWENEWKRFCKSFRESPENRPGGGAKSAPAPSGTR